MLDRGLFWTPASATLRIAQAGVTATPVDGLSQVLVSGPALPQARPLAGLPPAVGFSGVATGARYAAALARDRWLVAGDAPPALADGWDAASGLAVTTVGDGLVVLDLEGPGLAELLSKATTLPPGQATASASIVFAGLPAIAYRHGDPGRLRLHVERPLAATLALWLEQA